MLTPADAHTEHERNAHRAAERWLRDFREPYALGADGAPGCWTPDRWLSFAVLFLSDLLVAYLATKRQRQPLYDLVAAWQRCPAKSLFETGNFRPEVLATATDVGQATATDVGQVSSLYLMSEEFMLVAKSELKNSDFLQRGRIRYSAGIFCLGHALELTYKLLLLKDGGDYPKGHRYPQGHGFDWLLGFMTKEDKDAIHQIVGDAGWDSCDHFHCFMAKDIRHTDRKYYDFLSSFDHWTHDRSGQNLDAADTTRPGDHLPRPEISQAASQPPVSPDHWALRLNGSYTLLGGNWTLAECSRQSDAAIADRWPTILRAAVCRCVRGIARTLRSEHGGDGSRRGDASARLGASERAGRSRAQVHLHSANSAPAMVQHHELVGTQNDQRETGNRSRLWSAWKARTGRPLRSRPAGPSGRRSPYDETRRPSPLAEICAASARPAVTRSGRHRFGNPLDGRRSSAPRFVGAGA